jgi:hypothetical protein
MTASAMSSRAEITDPHRKYAPATIPSI